MKPKICKGCGLIIEKPSTSLQQTHQNIKCYRLWQKSIKRSKTATLRHTAGKDEDLLRRKADALFQQVCKQLKPKSIISGQPTEVIHHRIRKSESNNTRYYIPNGVPLTNGEHDSIHARGQSVELDIDAMMGEEWCNDLREKRRVINKLSTEYLEDIIIKLKEELL